MFLKRDVSGYVRALVAGVLLSACSFGAAQEVKTNYMPGTNFTIYKTYQWVDIAGAKYPNQIVDQEIKQAVNAQLAAKGYTLQAPGGKADLDVAYQVATQNQQQWNAYGMRGFGGMATATSSTITTGTLAVDFYDPAKQQLLWRGEASKTLNPSNNQQKNQQRLNQAVAKLLKNFPPR